MDEVRSAEPAELASVVEPIVRGKFALFETPNGGYHLTLQLDNEAEPRHIEVPKMMVKLMQSKANAMRVFGNGLE